MNGLDARTQNLNQEHLRKTWLERFCSSCKRMGYYYEGLKTRAIGKYRNIYGNVESYYIR